MIEILEELNKGNSVIIERGDLEKFLKYSESQPDYYSYMMEYGGNLVTIK